MTAAETCRVRELLGEATRLAREYYELTGRPLGVTGEVAEFEAARLLGLQLAPPRQQGYDATRKVGHRLDRIQIKGRRVTAAGEKKQQRTSRIRVDHEWDVLMLVLLDEHFRPTAIYEADRDAIAGELLRPGSKTRERGQLTATVIKRLGRQIWPSGSQPRTHQPRTESRA